MSLHSDVLTPTSGRVFLKTDSSSSQTQARLAISPVVLGGGVFGLDYNTPDTLQSSIPADTLRLAFRYGINTIDTSPYYTCSEEVLGRAFSTVADEFPRESYQIITKAGRYGRTKESGFDYSPARTRESIANSLKLFKTSYLDGVYMHDVEFVSEQVDTAGQEGWTVDDEGNLREEDLVRWGLGAADAAVIRGPGDQNVLDAMRTLFELKKEGLIRCVGFSGYPLPTLLRLARLVAAHLEPLDIMQSYCHHTLQNSTLSAFLPLFYAAGVKQVISASPLSMGILRNSPPPDWHPASPEMKAATSRSIRLVADHGLTLEDVALGFGLTSALLPGDAGVSTPIVVGLSTPGEVHETMRIYSLLYSDEASRKGRKPGIGLIEGHRERMELEKAVVEVFKASKTLNWTWSVGL